MAAVQEMRGGWLSAPRHPEWSHARFCVSRGVCGRATESKDLSSIDDVAGRYIEERFLDESPGLD
jgi:hypothetical protein